MMALCVNSQTPLIRFKIPEESIREKYGLGSGVIKLSSLREGEDYEYTPGGVTRMVLPMLKVLARRNLLRDACWVSLNPTAPSTVIADDITLNHVSLSGDEIVEYGKAKEAIWNAMHGIDGVRSPDELTSTSEFRYYLLYNKRCSETLAGLDELHNFDLFYIHDFQQLAVGHMLRTRKPKLFRWHIPLNHHSLSEGWRDFLLGYFRDYGAVVVSCKRYLKALRRLGYSGKAYQLYPYLDAENYRTPPKGEVRRFRDKFGLGEDDKVIMLVARLDPIKGQDRAIMALARIRSKFPDARLLIVGDGSFTSAREGIGMDKASSWAVRLVELAESLDIKDSVILAGHLSHRELEAAYVTSQFTILPSLAEGFGLVVVESWLYKKPVIVSRGAGVSELIIEGENGLLFDPTNIDELAGKISMLLSDQSLAQHLAENGYETSKTCHVEQGVKAEYEIMLDVISE